MKIYSNTVPPDAFHSTTMLQHPIPALFPIKDGNGFTLEIPEGITLGPGVVHFRLPKPRAAGEAAPEDEIPF